MLVGCQKTTDRVLSEINQNKQLIVVTRNAPTTYYDWHDEQTGLEYDMTQAFAASLGVEVKYLIKDSTADIIRALEQGEAHIAAAGLTQTENRENSFLFGPVYQQVRQQIVCRRGGKIPKTIEDLIGLKLEVAAETSYVDRLEEIKLQHPDLTWDIGEDIDTEDLLEKVWLRKIDCTIADSNIVAINRRYYPELKVSFDIGKPEHIAWMLPPEADALESEINHWFEELEEQGKLKALMDRYYGFVDTFDYVDTRKFVKRIHTVLPRYRNHFEKAANEHNINWTLLAAQAYQESHWRPGARSPTGVRGIMMLTLNTAKELEIKSRLDPVQSILGGARYFKKLYQRIPDEVQEPDRSWFSLAAYNVGMGHLYDARELAKRLQKNPNRWDSLSEVFPLLSRKKYYKTLKHGYARGREPVTYVRRIRDYQDILLQKLNHK